VLLIQSEVDSNVTRTVPWQQAILFIVLTRLLAGDLERTLSFAGMPTTFCRRQGWLVEPVVDENYEASCGLEGRWRRWRDREQVKRLGWGAIVSHSTLSFRRI
jgi:hypothetical protein